MNGATRTQYDPHRGTTLIRPLDKLLGFVNWLPWHLLVPVFFFMVMFLYYPFREVLQFDKDEGLSLMMAMLVEDGYELYDEVWSDHPPLFTYLLVAVFRVAGMEVNSGRLFALGLSSISVWAGFQILRWVWGLPHAIAGLVLFFLLPWYLNLSVSVMIGLPSIAFAMLALLALLRWHFTNHSIWLILSAIALACSVLIKVFTGVLVPIFLAGILVERYAQQRAEASKSAKDQGKKALILREGSTVRKIITPAAIWLAAFTALTALIGLLLVGPGNLYQLILPHLEATEPGLFGEVQFTINSQLQQSLPILGLSLVSALYIFKTKRWLTLYLLAWMVVAYLFLTQHSPVWYHLQLLVTVPGCLLAAAAVGEGSQAIGEMIRQREFLLARTILASVSLLGFAYIVYAETPGLFNQLRDVPVWTEIDISAGPYKEKLLKRIDRYAPQTHWMVTDLPMYAFRARLPVPPNLAVFTTKRLVTGHLTEEEIVETLQSYRPEQVLFTQPYYPGVLQYLNENYRVVRSQNTFNLYIRKDIE